MKDQEEEYELLAYLTLIKDMQMRGLGHKEYMSRMTHRIRDDLLVNFLDPTPGVKDYLSLVNRASNKSARMFRKRTHKIDFQTQTGAGRVATKGLEGRATEYFSKTGSHLYAVCKVLNPYLALLPMEIHFQIQEVRYDTKEKKAVFETVEESTELLTAETEMPDINPIHPGILVVKFQVKLLGEKE